MERLLGKVGLRLQVGLIGLVGIAIMLTIAVLSFTSMRHQEERQQEMDRSAAANELLSSINVSLLQARRHEKDFLLRSADSYVDKQLKATALASDSVERLPALLPAGEDRGLAQALKDKLAPYRAAFAEVAALKRELGLDENAGLMGTMRGAIHAIEGALKAHDEPAMQVLMLMMRRHEKDFLARHDPKYGDELQKRAAEFTALLQNSPLAEGERADILAKLAAYRASFLAVVAADLKLAETLKRVSESYAALEPVLMTLTDRVTADYGAAKDEIAASRAETAAFLMWLLGGGVAVLGLAALVIGLAIGRPIIGLTRVMGTLAGGDHQVVIPACDMTNELGEMARAVQVFKENAIEVEQLRAEQALQAQRLAEERKRMLNEMADALAGTVGQVVASIHAAAENMQQSSLTLHANAEQTSNRSRKVADAADQAHANVGTVASAADQLSGSISDISRQVSQSSVIAGAAVEEARRTNATVSSLVDAAQKIGEVVNLINDIASQTNLLALNATIEAARAGDAGKGFAVVASEVKNLASQTARATEDISSQVSQIQSVASGAAQAIQGVGGTIAQISGIVNTIAAAVEEQSAATLEIARNVQEASHSTHDVSSTIVDVTAAATETTTIADRVLAAARALLAQSETLSLEVNGFVGRVRMA